MKIKGKGKQQHLSYNIETVRKKQHVGMGMEILGKIIKILKNGNGEEYRVVGNFIHPCLEHIWITFKAI